MSGDRPRRVDAADRSTLEKACAGSRRVDGRDRAAGGTHEAAKYAAGVLLGSGDRVSLVECRVREDSVHSRNIERRGGPLFRAQEEMPRPGHVVLVIAHNGSVRVDISRVAGKRVRRITIGGDGAFGSAHEAAPHRESGRAQRVQVVSCNVSRRIDVGGRR